MSRPKVTSVRQRRIADTIAQKHGTLANVTKVGYDGGNQDPVVLAELTTRARKKLTTTQFAIPERRAYPIHDESHARNALARVAQHGTPQEKARVRAAVRRKFPKIAVQGKSKGGK